MYYSVMDSPCPLPVLDELSRDQTPNTSVVIRYNYLGIMSYQSLVASQSRVPDRQSIRIECSQRQRRRELAYPHLSVYVWPQVHVQTAENGLPLCDFSGGKFQVGADDEDLEKEIVSAVLAVIVDVETKNMEEREVRSFV